MDVAKRPEGAVTTTQNGETVTCLSSTDIDVRLVPQTAPRIEPQSGPTSRDDAGGHSDVHATLPYEVSCFRVAEGRHSNDTTPRLSNEGQQLLCVLGKWRSAVRRVCMLQKVLNRFQTLRDMRPRKALPVLDLEKVKTLKEGSSSIVQLYKYGNSSNKRLVALKQMVPKALPKQHELFIKEIKLLRKLQHRNIIEFIGTGSFDTSSRQARESSLFLAEEFMDGGTLSQMITKQSIASPKRAYSYSDALRWCIGIAEALAYLHQSHPKVVHRSVTSDNILLQGTEPTLMTAKLGDFGLHRLVPVLRFDNLAAPNAELLVCNSMRKPLQSNSEKIFRDRNEQPPFMERTSLSTRTSRPNVFVHGTRVGSFLYMAPEIFRGDNYNEKVDTFSFAMVMHEVFTGQLARTRLLAGQPNEELRYAAKVSEGFRPPIRAVFPEPFRQLLLECWAQESSSRPPMHEVVDKLKSLEPAITALDVPAIKHQDTPGCCAIS